MDNEAAKYFMQRYASTSKEAALQARANRRKKNSIRGLRAGKRTLRVKYLIALRALAESARNNQDSQQIAKDAINELVQL
jgi:hypothetical protein